MLPGIFNFMCSDVKRGQTLEAEAEDKSLRPRTNLRGQGRGQFSESIDNHVYLINPLNCDREREQVYINNTR